MNIRKLLGMIVLCLMTKGMNAQDTAVYRFGSQFRSQPMDFFLGISGTRTKNHLEHELQFNTGVNSTFFQQRFYPQISYRFSWLALDKHWLQIGPVALVNLSTRRFNKASSHGFSYEEQVLGGFSFGCGSRSNLRLTFAAGWGMEQNWSELADKQITYISWLWLGELAYRYAF